MPDYGSKIDALRRKAADPAVRGTPEAKTLLDKADELETKYGTRTVNQGSPFTDDTTVTSRDGRHYTPPPQAPHPNQFTHAYWTVYLQNLLDQQWQWNTEYYDKDGNPKQPEAEADADDNYTEEWETDTPYDEGYY